LNKFKLLLFLTLLVSCNKEPVLYQIDFVTQPEFGGSVNLNSSSYNEGDKTYRKGWSL